MDQMDTPRMSPDPPPGPPVKRKRGQCRYCPEIHPKLADLIKHEASHVQRPPEPPPPPVAEAPLPQPTKPDVIVKPPDSEQPKAQTAKGKKRPSIEPIEEENKRILEKMQQYDWTLNFVKITNTEKGQNLFQCKDCQLVLINKSVFELRRHNIVHTGEKLYSCPICNDKFQSSWNRKRHLSSIHAQEANTTPKSNNKRIKIEDPEDEEEAILAKMDNYDWTGEFEKGAEGEFRCKRCDTTLSNSSRSELAAHNMIHTGEKPFPCGFENCPDMFRTILVRDRHWQSFHQDSQINSPKKMAKRKSTLTLPPETLPKKKEKLREIKRPIAISGPTMKPRANNSLTVDENRIISEYNPWSKDFEKVKQGGITVARCLNCQKTLRNTTKANLYGHNAAHSNFKPFNCSFCPKSFHFFNTRIAHEAKFHSQQKATLKKDRKLQKPKEKISDLPKSSQPKSPSTTSVPLEGDSRASHDQSAANGRNCAKKMPRRKVKSERVDEDERRLIYEYDLNKYFERNQNISRCRTCSKSLRGYSAIFLYSHNSVHLGLKHFKCHFCPMTFHFPNSRLVHEKKFHTQKNTALKKHGKSQKRNEKIPDLRVLRSSKGSALSPALTTLRATDIHLGGDIPVQMKNREEEEERLLSEYDLEKDFIIKEYSGDTVYSCICRTCQKTLRNTSKRNLFCHSASHSNMKHFHCGFCSISFTYHSGRNSHEIKKHGRRSTRIKKTGRKPKSIASNVEEPQGLELEVPEASKAQEIEAGIFNNLKEVPNASSSKRKCRNEMKLVKPFKKNLTVSRPRKFHESSNLEVNEKKLISAYVWEKDFERDVSLDGRVVVRCHTCRKILRNTSRIFLFSHTAAHLGQKHFSCRFCHHSYTQPHNRLTHEFLVHKKPIKTRKSTLTITKRLSSEVASGSNAISVVSPSKKLSLLKDIKIEPSFTSKELEIRHKEYDPTNNYDFLDENSASCRLCEKILKNPTQKSLFYHFWAHSGLSSFACSVCPVSFKTPSTRDQHEKELHGIDRSKMGERNELETEAASSVESTLEGEINATSNPEIMNLKTCVSPQEVGKTSNKLALAEKYNSIVGGAGSETQDSSDEFICGDVINEDEEETDYNPEEFEEGTEMPNENQDDVQLRKPNKAQKLQRKAEEALILGEMRKFDPSSDFTCQKNGWKCNICEVTLKNSDPCGLNTHLIIHTGQNPFSAFCCEQKFARADYRDKHEKRHLRSLRTIVTTSTLENKKEEMDRIFCENRAQLKIKIRQRSISEKRLLEERLDLEKCSPNPDNKYYFKCLTCSKMVYKYMLALHQLGHTGEKLFSAFCCSRVFKEPRNRNKHETIHLEKLKYHLKIPMQTQFGVRQASQDQPTNPKSQLMKRKDSTSHTTSKFKSIQMIQIMEMAKSVKVGLLRIEADPDLAGVFAEALKKRGNLQEEKGENCADQNGETSMNLIIPESVEVKSEIPMDTFQNETFTEHNDSIQQSEETKPDSESDSREMEELEKDTEPIANALESPNKNIEVGLDAVLIETQPEVIQEVSKIDLEKPKGPKFLKNQRIPGNLNLKMRQFAKESSGYRCLICGRFFKNYGMLIHMQSHSMANRQNSKGPGGFPCSYCGKVFNKKEKLKEHEDLHKGRRQYNCGICLEKFKMRGAYYLHMKKHREDCKKASRDLKLPDKTPILCLIRLEKDQAIVNAYPGVFGRKNEQDPILKEEGLFNDDDLLEMDEAISDITNKSLNDEKIQSDWCSKDHFDFIEKNGKTAYRCKVCQKMFTARGYLKSHHQIHTGERPYKCECGKAFKQKPHLETHRLIHKGTVFKCECGKGLTNASNLARHKKTCKLRISQEF